MGKTRSTRPAGGSRPESDAEAILSLAEQSASAIQAMPGYDAGREGYAVTALHALVRAGRLILHERGGQGTSVD